MEKIIAIDNRETNDVWGSLFLGRIGRRYDNFIAGWDYVSEN